MAMTDGVDNALPGIFGDGSRTPFADLLDHARASDVIVLPVYLDTEREEVQRHRSTASAYSLAREQLTQLAYAVIANAGYTFKDTWGTPRLAAEFDYSSGDEDPFDDKHQTLDNLYPTNHKFYGYMDFFSLQNVQDIRMIFQIKPAPRLSVGVEGHAFWLASTSDSFYNVGGVARGAGRGEGGGRHEGEQSKCSHGSPQVPTTGA